MNRNLSVVINKDGGDLEILESIIEKPKKNEVQVEVYRAGVSYGEIIAAKTGLKKLNYPWTPGFDVTGTVIKVGENVTSLKVGDRVTSLCMTGGYTKKINIDKDLIVTIPEGVDFNAASGIVTNYLTAYQMIFRKGNVKKGDKVLIHGAAGGLGSALLDISRVLDLIPYCTVSQSKSDFVKSLGGIPIDYRTEDFITEINRREPEGVNTVFETIGTENAKRSVKVLKKKGTLVLSGTVELTSKNKTMTGIFMDIVGLKAKNSGKKIKLFMADPLKKRAWYRSDMKELLLMAFKRDINPKIDSVVPYTEANRAFKLMESGKVIGKVLLDFK